MHTTTYGAQTEIEPPHAGLPPRPRSPSPGRHPDVHHPSPQHHHIDDLISKRRQLPEDHPIPGQLHLHIDDDSRTRYGVDVESRGQETVDTTGRPAEEAHRYLRSIVDEMQVQIMARIDLMNQEMRDLMQANRQDVTERMVTIA